MMTPTYRADRIAGGLGWRVVNVLTGRSVPGEYSSQARAERSAAARDLEFSGGKIISGYGAGRRGRDVERERESNFLRNFRRSLGGS